jgi:hypothetical protein
MVHFGRTDNSLSYNNPKEGENKNVQECDGKTSSHNFMNSLHSMDIKERSSLFVSPSTHVISETTKRIFIRLGIEGRRQMFSGEFNLSSYHFSTTQNELGTFPEKRLIVQLVSLLVKNIDLIKVYKFHFK